MAEIKVMDPLPAEPQAEPTPVAAAEPEATPSEPIVEGAEGGSEAEDHAEDVHKKKTGSQRAREAAQRERERAARLEGELEALRRQVGVKPAAPADAPVGKPKVEDYESHTDYVEALTDWKVDQKLQSQAKKNEQSSNNAEWEKRKDSARARYQDFDEVLEDGAGTAMSPLMAEAMIASEVGGDLAYYFASHPEEARKVAAMSAFQAGKALAALEAKLSESSKTKPTSAPKPPTPVKAPASVPVRDNDGFVVY